MLIDASLVRRLIGAQYPQWAELPVTPVAQSGWDNRTFHLGDKMSVRLPSAAHHAAQVEKEQLWLPKLAPHLPLPIPAPLAQGAPGEGYEWPWSIYQWIEGETASRERIADLPRFATALAAFLRALQRIDVTGGPPPAAHSFHRGGSLAVYDAETRKAITALGDAIDGEAAKSVWETACAAHWVAPPVWVHGDVAAGNLLVQNGQLSAVIDFGCSAIGDPACDLVIAWTFLDKESRDAFRMGLPLDAATWARGRGWCLWKALIVMARAGADPREVEFSSKALDAVLADHARRA